MSSIQKTPDLTRCGGCGQKAKKGVTFKICSGCGFEAYCSFACQGKGWSAHKAICKIKRKEREAAKEKGSGSGGGGGSGLEDMGSIMAVLIAPQPQLQQYDGGHLYDACAMEDHEEVQRILQQRGLEIDWAEPEDGVTSAIIAAERGNDKCLALLILRGADMTKATKPGFAPIHVICQYSKHVCLELMANSGVDLNLRAANEQGSTPVMMCCQSGNAKGLALLSDRGADLELTTKDGLTAAHVACQCSQLKCLELLGKRGADLNKKDVDGRTPLDHARAFKQRECMNFLLAKAATSGPNPLFAPWSEADKVCLAGFLVLYLKLVFASFTEILPS
jgi:hypothetical protein